MFQSVTHARVFRWLNTVLQWSPKGPFRTFLKKEKLFYSTRTLPGVVICIKMYRNYVCTEYNLDLY